MAEQVIDDTFILWQNSAADSDEDHHGRRRLSRDQGAECISQHVRNKHPGCPHITSIFAAKFAQILGFFHFRSGDQKDTRGERQTNARPCIAVELINTLPHDMYENGGACSAQAYPEATLSACDLSSGDRLIVIQRPGLVAKSGLFAAARIGRS
jgi:hypothetical protein